MGYSTDFKGELRFVKELTAIQLVAVKAMLGEDCREHPEWNAEDLYYIDLELSEDFGGVKWNGAEKTYGLEGCVNVVLRQMRAKWPDFALTGQLAAQGEDAEDRWALVIGADGLAHRQKVALTGAIITCPYCEKRFSL